MGYYETIKRIRTYFSTKNPTINHKRKTLYLLESMRDKIPAFYYNSLGKIDLIDNNYQQALNNFKKALEIEKDNQSSLYQSFKANIYLDNFEEAMKYYDAFLINVNHNPYNYNLMTKLLLIYRDMKEDYLKYREKDYEITEVEVFATHKINDESIKNIFNDLVDALNRKNLEQALVLVKKLEKEVARKNIPIEVKTIKYIIEKINKLEKEYYNNVKLSSELPIDLIIKIINKKNVSEQEICKVIREFINKDIDVSVMLVERFIKSEKTYYLLKKEIQERQKYLNLTEDKKKLNNKYIEEGRKALKEGNNSLAYDYYLAGRYVTKNPVFDYYLGKTFYRNGDFGTARRYLNKYNEEGGLKILKSYYYLMIIADREKNYEEKEKYRKILNTLNKTYGDFYIPKDVVEEENSEDYEKKYEMKYMREKFDFSKDYLDLNLSNREFMEILKKLKKMLKEGKVKEVNQILKQIVPRTKEEKRMLRQFIKNKKLYKNQNHN